MVEIQLVALDARGLTFRYPRADRDAVAGLSFRCAQGSVTTLLGPNGAGKSTTMDLLTGTRPLKSGTLEIQGHDTARNPHAARRDCAYLLQYSTLAPWVTPEQCVRIAVALSGRYSYALRYSGMPAAYRNEIARSAEMLELADALHTRIDKLSGGQKRKVELMRALMLQPRVLFLDEPTVGLDANSRRAVWEHIVQLAAKAELTVLASTHYLGEAERSDQVVVIVKGMVRESGTPAALRERHTLTRLHLRAPDMGALRNELIAGGLEVTGSDPLSVTVSCERASALIQSLKVRLSYCDMVHESLEDAYIKLTGAEQ